MQLGERIRYRRKRQALSQRRLAKLCGVEQSIICRLESDGKAWHGGQRRGTNPGAASIQKIAHGLGCLPEYLLGARQEYMQAWVRSLPADRLLAMATPQLRLSAVLEELQEMYGEDGSIDALAAEMQRTPASLLSDDHADSFWAELSKVTGVPVEFYTPAPALEGALADYGEALSLAVENQMPPDTLREVIQRWIEQKN